VGSISFRVARNNSTLTTPSHTSVQFVGSVTVWTLDFILWVSLDMRIIFQFL